MLTNDYPLPEVLTHLDCAECNHDEWVKVGMALKSEGFNVDEWVRWSQTDMSRFHPGECEKVWKSFNGQGVTAGTIIHLATSKGWKPEQKHSADTENYALDWDSEIGNDGDYITDCVAYNGFTENRKKNSR